MDAYPQDYLVHNYPFIVLSGFSVSPSTPSVDGPLLHDDGSTEVGSSAPSIGSDRTDQLRQCFLQEAGTKDLGKRRSPVVEAGRIPFRIVTVGRSEACSVKDSAPAAECLKTYRFPPRKATRQKIVALMSPDTGSSGSDQPLILHSPLSPLSPGSPTFPDGIMTPLWVVKHQRLLPSAFISLFVMSAEGSPTSADDNKLKAEILNMKRSIAALSPGTRYMVVLMSEQSTLESSGIDERLTSIRRATGLDPKTSLFLLPADPSPPELQLFARAVLSTIQPTCVEYYRDLSKHARRKRNRGSVPAPTLSPVWGTSQTLSSQGWNVRYDFKLGVFAEFRQEMETATRHFEAAYENLVSSDVFELIASWSPRWNEARMLADALSIRIIRCLLWNKQSTAAVRRWQQHRGRMRDLVDRRGKGSANYGWDAWEATWSKVMADLVHELALPGFGARAEGQPADADATVFAGPEKSIPVGERLAPWQLLHHSGYFVGLMTRHLYARRSRARLIPEEDRNPPGLSPASQVANKSYLYDTYLCPEPYRESPLPGHQGVDHSAMIIEALDSAKREFSLRHQHRMVERLNLETGKECIRCASWTEGIRVLRPLWQHMSWRREGWWDLVAEVCWALRACAERVGDGRAVVAVEWELMSNFLPARNGYVYDLGNCLARLKPVTAKPIVVLRAGEVASFLSVSYAFRSAEGNVGEQLLSELVIQSRAHQSALPVTLTEIQILYQGALRPILLRHRHNAEETGESDQAQHFFDVSLEDKFPTAVLDDVKVSTAKARSITFGTTNLRLSPGQIKIFRFASLSREAGDVHTKSVTLSLTEELFELDYTVPLEGKRQAGDWWTRTAGGLRRQRLNREWPGAIKIMPRPPRMQIEFDGIKSRYYANERITIPFDVRNEEDEETEASSEVRILGDFDEPPPIGWSSQTASGDDGKDESLPGHRIGVLAPAEQKEQSITFPAAPEPVDYVVEIKIHYHKVSDPDTSVSKVVSLAVPTVIPFEATYDFSPRVHEAPWPKHLDAAEGDVASSATVAQGITQKWVLSAVLASLTEDQLCVESIDLQEIAANGRMVCSITDEYDETTLPITMTADASQQLRFGVQVQKLAIDDRRPVALDLVLSLKWRRSQTDASTNATTLHLPRLVVHGGEPRVLASIQYSSAMPNLVHLDYTIENPSPRPLIFSIVMEANEDFAFYGPKAGSLQLAPIGRRRLRYNLYPTVRGTWIQPQLKVVDHYFNKSLRAIATEGMRMDKKGILVWVNAEG